MDGDDSRAVSADGADSRAVSADGDDSRAVSADGDDSRAVSADGDDSRAVSADGDHSRPAIPAVILDACTRSLQELQRRSADAARAYVNDRFTLYMHTSIAFLR